jgi:hypothetical protein
MIKPCIFHTFLPRHGLCSNLGSGGPRCFKFPGHRYLWLYLDDSDVHLEWIALMLGADNRYKTPLIPISIQRPRFPSPLARRQQLFRIRLQTRTIRSCHWQAFRMWTQISSPGSPSGETSFWKIIQTSQ